MLEGCLWESEGETHRRIPSSASAIHPDEGSGWEKTPDPQRASNSRAPNFAAGFRQWGFLNYFLWKCT